MRLPIETFLDTAKVDLLDTAFYNSFLNGPSTDLRDHIDFKEYILSGDITFVANAPIEKQKLDKSILQRLIISQFYDGNSHVRILNKEEGNQKLRCGSRKNLFSVNVLSDPNQAIPPLPTWQIKNFPEDWKGLSKLNQKLYLNGGKNPSFLSWRDMDINQGNIQSIIIIDRYFLKYKEPALINIEKILEGLIKDENQSKNFHLTIVTMENQNSSENKNYIIEVQNEFQTELRSKYPLMDLTILYVSEKLYHDRYLLTDFYFLFSGGGYTLFNERGLVKRPISNLINYFPLSIEKGENDSLYIFKNAVEEIYNFIQGNKVLRRAGKIDRKLFRILEK